MKGDIRVIKQIGIISSNEGNCQKELNIVSVNSGPFRYDLREWSKDHSSFRDGISLESKEAQTLLSLLFECFEDGGDNNTVKSYIEVNYPDQSGTSQKLEPAVEQLSLSDEALYAWLKDHDIEFTDMRDKGGALWIVGRHELDGIMVAFGELGYKFCYSEKGGKITKGQPGWYLPKKKDI